jgi:hypothetical protein
VYKDATENLIQGASPEIRPGTPRIRTATTESWPSVSESLSQPDAVPPQAHPHAHSITEGGVWHVASNAARAAGDESCAHPWWLWWNILSVDAPAVAVVWAVVFSRSAHLALGAVEALVLGLTVWVIYTGDRLLDGWSTSGEAGLQARHRFCANHRAALAMMILFAAAASMALAIRDLPLAELTAGAKLAAIVAAYIVGIHGGRGFLAQLLPKELAVGVLFAAGTTLPMWSQARSLSWTSWLALLTFAALCSLNCLSIQCWENGSAENHGFIVTQRVTANANALVAWAGLRIDAIAGCLAVVALFPFFLAGRKTLRAPKLPAIAVAAVLMLLLNRYRHRFSRPGLRVLADAILIMAGLFALFTQT